MPLSDTIKTLIRNAWDDGFPLLVATSGPLGPNITPKGSMVVVGAPEHPIPVHAFALIFGAKNLSGSMIGSIKETQEMLDFCGKHNIVSEIETINIQDVNEAYERVLKSDVRYRFVIDMASLDA